VEPSNELITKLNASADKIGQWVEEAEAFAREQAPLVVQEFLAWGWWKHALGAVATLAGLLLIAVIIKLVHRGHVRQREENAKNPRIFEPDGWGIAFFASSLIGSILGFIGLTFSVWSAMVCVQITIAPRVYLLEQLGLLK
jgi:hypothetical protein